ncbi:hypothetical protein I302_102236 [Kwoniella bestiolae CBS 10118]|uniref:Histone-lysine N-methyltransferase SUV39H n=1 Tax=Kwoniella bestiolae CBS 10118 TaxID=1296100 RepID=A0A1B9GEH4_9TREE|nr:hypothetical protein I302_00925 [Kwoniella bestiolae CBS 10118]OCF29420.1 hypothetical protein I302_00925 [Kwoniella bestiolae CBS 10118]
MSTPSRGTGDKKDPISLDSSDEDVPKSTQAGPSRRGSRPGVSTSSVRRSCVPQPSQVVDLTFEDSGSDTAFPSSSKPPSSSSNSTRKTRRSVPSSLFEHAIDLSDDQLIAGPSRWVKEQAIGEVGSWLNPAVYDPNAPKSKDHEGSPSCSRVPTHEAESGSWLNPATYVPPTTRLICPVQDGSWLNPTVLQPPNLPPKADFALPQTWTNPAVSQDFELPQSWTNPSSLSSTPAPPPSLHADNAVAGPSRLTNKLTPPTPPEPSSDRMEATSNPSTLNPVSPTLAHPINPLTETPAKLGSWSNPAPWVPDTAPAVPDDTSASGSWLDPATFVPPHSIAEPSEPESGSWMNPAVLQPTISYKRSPSPTELVREGSKSRKGKQRKLDNRQMHLSNLTEEGDVEPHKPAKKGPSWVTFDQPVKDSMPVEQPKAPIEPLDDIAGPQDKEKTPLGQESGTDDIVMGDAGSSETFEAVTPPSKETIAQMQDVQMNIALPTAGENIAEPQEDIVEPHPETLELEPPNLSPRPLSPQAEIIPQPVMPAVPSKLPDQTSALVDSSDSIRTENPATVESANSTTPPDVPPKSVPAESGSRAEGTPKAQEVQDDEINGMDLDTTLRAIEKTSPAKARSPSIQPETPEVLVDNTAGAVPREQTTESSDIGRSPTSVVSQTSSISVDEPSVQTEPSLVNATPPIATTDVPVPHTPEISMPQTPQTSDSQEVDAVLGSLIISPIAEMGRQDSTDHTAPTANIEEATLQPDQSVEPLPTVASPTINPLPSGSYNRSPEIAAVKDTSPLQPTEAPSVTNDNAQNLLLIDSDVKPIIPLPSNAFFSSASTQGLSSMHPIEIDDDDLDCLTSDKEDESPTREDVMVEKAVEEVRIGVDDVDIAPGPPDGADDATRQTRRSSSAPPIEEITGDNFTSKFGESSRSANRLYGSAPGDFLDVGDAAPIARSRLRPNRRIISSPEEVKSVTSSTSSKAESPTPKFEVVIPTRSRKAWRWIVEHEGESDVEDLLDDNSDGPPSSGPSNAVELIEHNGFTIRSAFPIPITNDIHTPAPDDIDHSMEHLHTVFSEILPDPLPPSDRIGTANRILNTKLIDDWNRRKPHLTNNASLHRAVFEAYMAQSTSIDEPQADEIRVVNDIDAEGAPPDFEFQYSNDMLYNPDVPDPELGIGCDCDGPCDPSNKRCSCVRRQELYFYDLGMKGFAYDDQGRIKETSVSVWECGKNCGCPPECGNRVIQRGRGKDTKIELFKTRWKGWGVRARAPIAAGTFLGIYAGELITEQESEERGRLYAQIGRTYLFDCDGWQIAHPPPGLSRIDPRLAELAELASQRAKIAADEADDPSYVYSAYSVDAFHYGFTRYFNHSCDPNLAITQAYVKDFHPERPILVIFARRPIARNEELCISYKGLPDDDEIPIPSPQPKLTTRNAKAKKSKTSASAHITPTTKGKVAAKDRCMCRSARCDGRMFNYGG